MSPSASASWSEVGGVECEWEEAELWAEYEETGEAGESESDEAVMRRRRGGRAERPRAGGEWDAPEEEGEEERERSSASRGIGERGRTAGRGATQCESRSSLPPG